MNLILILFTIFNLLLLKNINFLAHRFKTIDKAKYKLHSVDTAKFGFFLFLNISFFLLIYIFLYQYKLEYILNFFFLISFTLIGYFDDRVNLKIFLRFIVSFIIALFFYYLTPKYFFVSINFPPFINFILIIFFTLGFIHLINITDGLNGFMPVIFFYTCLYFYFKGYAFLEPFFQFLLLLSILGISIFLIPNFFGYCFLGNSGSYSIAIILSVLYSHLFIKNILEYSDILLIFFIPFIDGLRVTIIRIYLKKNPFKGDFLHAHHLVKKNKLFIFLYFCIVLIPSVINFNFSNYSIYIGIISLIFYFLFLKLIILK